MSRDFIVVDTEGKHQLKEIAIVNSEGNLIYQATSIDYPNLDLPLHPTPDRKRLQQILNDFLAYADSKQVIFHHARHDLVVLKESFWKAAISFPEIDAACTLELAKQRLPDCAGYSLEFLSKYLDLKVNGKHFNPDLAHDPCYDALFTYQLYQFLNKTSVTPSPVPAPGPRINPFGSNRVDHPFQQHPDLRQAYEQEYEKLQSVIRTIQEDPNHQSQGAVLVGEPGSGKTHLMMRLAQDRLSFNRLLFIRQPNNPDAILYHIYSRILESLIQKVEGDTETQYTQLEYLLAHCFTQILQYVSKDSAREQAILTAVTQDPLKLYEVLGSEGTQKKRDHWQLLEKRTREWWGTTYSLAGYAPRILEGIIKFCSYTDPRRKELVTRWLAANELSEADSEIIGLPNWTEEVGREAFALEAIALLGKLSILDAPLILVFDQLEGLGYEHNRQLLLRFGDVIKELFTHVPNSFMILNLFPDRWQQFQKIFDMAFVERVSQHEVYLSKPSSDQLKAILQLKLDPTGQKLDDIFTADQLVTILAQPSVRSVINAASRYYDNKEPKMTDPPSLEARVQQIEDQIAQIHKTTTVILSFIQAIQAIDLSLDPDDPVIDPDPPTISDPSSEILRTYLDKLKQSLSEELSKPRIVSSGEDYGKLRQIAEFFRPVVGFGIEQLRFNRRVLPSHILIRRNSGKGLMIGFLHERGNSFLSRIGNLSQLVIHHKEIEFYLYRDAVQGMGTSEAQTQSLERFSHTTNANFHILDFSDRLSFELIYSLIVDIQNRDLEVDMKDALHYLLDHAEEYWIVRHLMESR